MFIFAGSGIDDFNSNPEQGCLLRAHTISKDTSQAMSEP